MERLKERILIRLAWAMPRSLAYWAFIRVAAHGTTGQWGNQHPDTLSVMEAMKRWHEPHVEQPPLAGPPEAVAEQGA